MSPTVNPLKQKPSLLCGAHLWAPGGGYTFDIRAKPQGMARAMLLVQSGSTPQPTTPKDRNADRDWEKVSKGARKWLSDDRITKVAVVSDSSGSEEGRERSEEEMREGEEKEERNFIQDLRRHTRGRQGRQTLSVGYKFTPVGSDRDFHVLSGEEGYAESSSDNLSPGGDKSITTEDGGLKMRKPFVMRGGRDPGEGGSSSSNDTLSQGEVFGGDE